jgi:hypothetical protein
LTINDSGNGLEPPASDRLALHSDAVADEIAVRAAQWNPHATPRLNQFLLPGSRNHAGRNQIVELALRPAWQNDRRHHLLGSVIDFPSSRLCIEK